jgi:hypothetical protein
MSPNLESYLLPVLLPRVEHDQAVVSVPHHDDISTLAGTNTCSTPFRIHLLISSLLNEVLISLRRQSVNRHILAAKNGIFTLLDLIFAYDLLLVQIVYYELTIIRD